MTLTPEEKRQAKNAYAKQYYQEHKEKCLEYQRNRYLNNRTEALAYAKAYAKSPKAASYRKSKAYRDKQKAWAARPEVKERRRQYRQDNPSQWKQRWQEAEAGRPRPDRCEICGASDQPIVFDHCHERGIFRAWICKPCNSVLGFVNDDANRLRQLAAYLERTKDLIPPQLTLPL